MLDAVSLPLLTAALPGTGGRLRVSPDDFRVVERPAYEPSGDGDHVFVTIEKRDLTTFEAVKRIAAAVDVRASDIGTAGMKDRHAVTVQRLSLPPPCSPEQALAVAVDGIRIVDAARHPHKLKTGHLRGNQFVITIRDTAAAADQAAARAEAILGELARPPGLPNGYGEQRFGARGDTAAVGRALLRGERTPGRPPRGKKRRLFISAYQSLLFNEYLRRRIEDGLYRTALAGDVMEKRTGGRFVSTEPEVDQARVDAGEIAPTGPMFGPKMMAPPPGSAAAEREAAVLAADDATVELFAGAGKLAAGTRRAIGVPVIGAAARPVADRAIEITFELPAGAYATELLREIVKGTPSC
jgi:tRNA pseudouridine13 synthase